MTIHANSFTVGEKAQVPVHPLKYYLEHFNSPNETFNLNVAGALEIAIGKPEIINTAKDERLGRIFSNRIIRLYPAFKDFYGLEDTIQTFMDFVAKAAAGFQQERMMPYLHGLPSSGKTSMTDCVLNAFEKAPIWTLAVKGKVKDDECKETEGYIVNPIGEHPLGLFSQRDHGQHFEDVYQIPRSRLQTVMSPWAAYHLQRRGLEGFYVTLMRPFAAMSTCIASADFSAKKDTSFLIGRPGAECKRRNYVYNGAFNRTTQGILELIEIFKADPKLLNVLLTATQDRWYIGDGGIGKLPYQGLLLASSNTSDWEAFKALPAVDGFLSRVFEIPVPLPTSVDAEKKILREVIRGSSDRNMPIAPGSLRVAAALTVASRIHKSYRGVCLRLYNGEHLGKREQDLPEWNEEDKRKISADDFRKKALSDRFHEGVSQGLVIRQIQKWLPQLADSDPNGTQELAAARAKARITSNEKEVLPEKKEVGLDPVSMIQKLMEITERECNPELQDETALLELIEEYCVEEAERTISLLVRRAHPEEYNWFLRDRFGKHFALLDAWLDDREYKDPDSDRVYNLKEQEAELLKLEKPLRITESLKDFRGRLCEKIHPLKDEFLKKDGTPWRNIDPDLWCRIEEVLLPSRETMLPSDVALKGDPKLWSVDYQQYRDTKYRQECHAKFVLRFIRLCTDEKEGTTCTPFQAQRMIQWWVGGCEFDDLV